MVLGTPRSQLALEGPCQAQSKRKIAAAHNVHLLYKVTVPLPQELQQAKKAIDTEKLFHVPRTALKAGRVQAGGFLSNFFKVSRK